MKLFVTGGAGFIGSNFARHVLHHSDDSVVVYDALTYAGNIANLADLRDDPRFTFVEGDICDREAVRAAMTGCDRVVHFAAETHVDRSLLGPDVFVRTNCDGTNVLCDTATQIGVDRFLHISTDEVYGSIEEGSFAESDPLQPRSPYSAAKAGSDLIALAYHETYDLPVVVTRSSNQFGPYQFPEKLIPFFVTTLLEGGRVPLYGDGLNVRDWLFVLDNCTGVHAVLEQGDVGGIYNIGAGNERTNREITDTILAALGKDESSVDYVEDRKGHDRRYSIDTAKSQALGWSPSRTFEDAIDETIRWYVDHRDWWEPLRARVKNR
ncbi:MAG TPA: dTDP-glucose 4,6-dehydratase [Microthrixaceae bacterium]|nr:dTDP-glucose 4,6-dehydratase [Microthrixaceae bacterium]HMT22831.1 dTDP-glucose 4,6-dehydratase [Microthrixaceae bacterium]HMT59583.1 dTDP-glucose 4,6-dehydratase [Microthrixaceae bacterium]